jgi:hypothetical protein
MLRGTDPFLEGTMILLQGIVQALHRPMMVTRPKEAFFLALGNGRPIALGFVGVNPNSEIRRHCSVLIR